MDLSKALTTQYGGLYTNELAALLKISRAKAWKILRQLEIEGVLEGEALDRRGNCVERGLDGKPQHVGAEIRWFVKSSSDKPSEESRAAAEKILAACQTSGRKGV